MSATEVSPSQSIEASLLGYNHAPPSPSTLPPSPLQNQTHEPQEVHLSSQIPAPSDLNPDIMDHQPTPPPNELEEPPPTSPPPANHEIPPALDGQDHDRMAVDSTDTTMPAPEERMAEPVAQDPSIPPSLPLPPQLRSSDLADLLNPSPPPQVLVAVQSNEDPIPPIPAPLASNDAGDVNVDVSSRERSATDSSTDHTQEMEEDSDDDDYDGHTEFLNHFREDTSSPTDEELREIEARAEKTGLDNEEWQKAIFTSLDDPEHIPGESGTIIWTLQGFHGTKQNPNKKRILRSPSVVIGGYKWNIKVFPHGNEGTDHISVYVECLGEGSTTDQDEMEATPTQDNANTETSAQPSTESKVAASAPVVEDAPAQRPWDVAAQIGCVMYNPQEPRVWTFEKATHHFEDASQDWGWVRFYGPWSGIHQRRHMQRKPMLQNDTLSFTAFVRVVKDPTKALWWKPVDQLTWDSIAKTGYRGLSAEEPAHYSFVASLAPWLHLQPFRDLIMNAKIPDSVEEPLFRCRPLFEMLQGILYKKHSPRGSSSAVALHPVQHAFEWYDHSFTNSSDVIEVWESLRNVLNEEYYNGDPSNLGPDILDFVKTIRQSMRPILPAEKGQEMAYKELHSVQEVLDDASNISNPNYKDWEGYDKPGSNFPSVLQIELHRQRYDVQSRKWKKLTHKIKLDESVTWKSVQFTLFSIVIHKGELGSGRFYSIVRPGGPESKWVRYKSSLTSYLTQRQAVESHEGKGDAREGTESVAYIAIYARSDQFLDLAPVPKDQSESGVVGPLSREEKKVFNLAKQDDVPVVVHKSSAFQARQGPGLVDPYSPDKQGRYEFRVPSQATLCDIQKELVSTFNVAGNPEQCRLWPMRTSPTAFRFLPHFEQFIVPETPLLDFAARLGGVHLWLHVIPSDQISEPPPVPTVSPTVLAQTSDSLPTQPLVALEQPPENQDVVMGGTQENFVPEEIPVIDIPEAPPASTPPTIEEVPVADATPKASGEKQWQLQDQLYILLKKFDPESQRVDGIGGFFVRPTDRIRNVLPTLMTLPDSFKVYHENDSIPEDPDLSPDATFSSSGLVNGSILVAQPDNLSESLSEKIYNRGDALTVPELFQTVTFGSHFTLSGSLHVGNYFGGPYTYAPLRKGRFFGECTMIDDTTGDAFVGKCVGGCKSGQGVMYYANGDTYTGEWANSLPEGQGTMVYNTTGNTYVGGWKNGRRHGKGVMNFEVADEELQLCKICYENEMDALFYRCGHVAACEMCARQVRDCPVCRRPVDAVVRIWKT